MSDKTAYAYARVMIPVGALSTKELVGDLLPEASVLGIFDSDGFVIQSVGFIPDGVGSSTGNWVIDNGPPPGGIGDVQGSIAEGSVYDVEIKVTVHGDGTSADTEVRIDGVVLVSYTGLDGTFYGFDANPDAFFIGQWGNIEQYQPGGTVGIEKCAYSQLGYYLDGAPFAFFYDFTLGVSTNLHTGFSGGTVEDPFDDGSGFAVGDHFAGPETFAGVDVWGSFGGGGMKKAGLGAGGGALTVTAYSPSHGTKGALVLLTGTGFLEGATCTFNGKSSPRVIVLSGTQMYVVCPSAVVPLFTQEGPDFYDAAFAHNKDFAKPGPYNSGLSPADEIVFKAWVVNQSIPFDVNAATVDYDMRSYWYQSPGHGLNSPTYTPGDHFPDKYKTPYDTSFSNESTYATSDCPFAWTGNVLYDTRDGSIVFAASADIPIADIAVTVGAATADKAGWVVDGDGNPLAPTINSFTPTEGDAGTTVVIDGTNLDTLTAVMFNYINATSFVSKSAAKAEAVAPPGVSQGPIIVENPAGSYLSDTPFV